MPPCTPDQQEFLSAELARRGIETPPNLFYDAGIALATLTRVKQAMCRSEEPKGTHLMADRYGARILGIAHPELLRVQNTLTVAHERREPATIEDAERTLRRFFERKFDCGSVTPQDVATDVAQRSKGFSPLSTPSVPCVEAALREQPDAESDVYAINAGGTDQQEGFGAVSGRNGVHLRSYATRAIDRRFSRNWDEFWSQFFSGKVLQTVKTLDPDRVTIAMGPAFPVQTFTDPLTHRTDGDIVHTADKLDIDPSLAPKNAEQLAHWTAPPDRPSMATSLRAFLQKATGKNFPKIVIGCNDTNTGEIAYCATERARNRMIGCVVDGTGFNVAVGPTNFEAGHYVGNFRYSAIDRISLAQAGGGALDVECLCCGKILGVNFLNAVRACGDDALTDYMEALSPKDRDILIFRIAHDAQMNLKSLTPLQNMILRSIATPLVERAHKSLATMLAGIHLHTGVQAIFGEGSYVRKEQAYVKAVNALIRKMLPTLQEDLLVIEPLPVHDDADPQAAQKMAASFVGLFLDAHGQELIARSRQ